MKVPGLPLLFALLFHSSYVLSAEHAAPSDKINRPVESRITSIPGNACESTDLIKYSGLRHPIQFDGRRSNTELSPFPLFEQKEEKKKELEAVGIGEFSSVEEVEKFAGYHIGLSTKVFDNFLVLLNHGLSCGERGKPEFYNELKDWIKHASTPPHSPLNTRYDAKAKKNVPRQIESDPEMKKDAETVKSFFLQLEFLESLKKEQPELFKGILEQLRNNENEGNISEKLSQVILKARRELQGSSDKKENAAKVAALLMGNSPFASILPPKQISYYRQLLALGPNLAFTPKDESSQKETFEEHKARLTQTLKQAFSNREASQKFLGDRAQQDNNSPLDRESYWPDFEQRVRQDLAKLKPHERNQFRDNVLKSIKDLEKTTDRSYSPEITHAREALIRASRLIEAETEDPLKSRKSDLERELRGHFSNQIEVLKKSLNSPADPQTGEIDKVLAKAEEVYKITIPEEVKNKIRIMDPFVLNLLKDNLQSAPSLKNFFLTGHSTALFNLKDKDISRLLLSSIERLNRQNPNLSTADKNNLLDLLGLVQGNPSVSSKYFKSGEEWNKNYPELRKKLLESIKSDNLTDSDKATLFAIEMLDSVNNHNVNPYAFWENRSTADFYEPEQVAARLREEQKLTAQLQAKPEEVVSRISELIPRQSASEMPYQGIPSHARLAQLHRMARGSGDQEQDALKLFSDLMSRKGKGELSQQAQDTLKKFAFANSNPEELTTALASQNPESVALFSTLQQGLGENVKDSENRKRWEEFTNERNKEIIDVVRQAKVQLGLSLRELRQDPENSEALKKAAATIGVLEILNKYDSMGPESFLAMEPQDILELRAHLPKEITQKLAGLIEGGEEKEDRIFQETLITKQPLTNEQREQLRGNFQLGRQIEDSFTGLARLGSRLGKDDPRYTNVEKLLRERFPTDFDQRLATAGKQLKKEEDSQEEGKRSLLKKYPKDLAWDDEHQAFVLDLNNSQITDQMRADLSMHFPDYKLILRDKEAGGDVPYLNGEKALYDLIELRSQEIVSSGLPLGDEQWFPLNNKTALKLVKQSDGSFKTIIGDRVALEAELAKKVNRYEDTRDKYQAAQDAYGNWRHGTEGFFRGLGNFYLLGLVDGPEGSKKTKELTKTWNGMAQAQMDINQFGLLEYEGKTADATRSNQLQYMGRALGREREQIQKYFDNAMLAHDATLLGLSLLAGGLPAAFEGTLMSATELAAARQVGGFLGRGLSFGTQARMGLTTFKNLGLSSITQTPKLSWPMALPYGYDSYQTSNQMAEIEKNYRAGKEWRKYPKKPEPKEGQSQADYNKEWIEWSQELEWDRNEDGKPDFLQPELKAYAKSGPDSQKYLQQLLDTQRTLFLMGGVGQALPGSGMLTHVFGGAYLDQQLRMIQGKGVPGRFTEDQTQLGALKDSALGTAQMLPGLVLQRVGMASVPTGLQKQFRLGPVASNTKEVVGTLGFAFGNQATHAILNGKMPDYTNPETAASIAMDLYIGHGMARAANIEMARGAIRRLSGSSGNPALEGPGGTQAPKNPRSLKELARSGQFSPEEIDMALMTMSPAQLAQLKSPNFLKEAKEYIESRNTQFTEQLRNNPYKDKTLLELEQEIRGSKGWRIGKNSLKQLKEALDVKSKQGQFEYWTQNTAAPQLLDNQLARLGGTAEAQKTVREQLSPLTSPEAADALIAAAKRKTPLSTRLGQQAGGVIENLDRLTGIPSAFWQAASGLPGAQSAAAQRNRSRANQVLLDAYVASSKNPKVQEQIGNLIHSNRPEVFGGLQAKQIDPQSANAADAVKSFTASKLLEVYRNTGQRPTNAEEIFSKFQRAIEAQRQTSPEKTLEAIWQEFSSGASSPNSNLNLPSAQLGIPVAPPSNQPTVRESRDSRNQNLPRNPNATPVDLAAAANHAPKELNRNQVEAVLKDPIVKKSLQDAHSVSGTSPPALRAKTDLARESLSQALQRQGSSPEESKKISENWATQLIREGVLGDEPSVHPDLMERVNKFLEAQGKIPPHDAHAGAEYRTRKAFRALPRETPWNNHDDKHRRATSEAEAKAPNRYRDAQFWPDEASTPAIAETVTKRMEKDALVTGFDKAMKSQDIQTETDGRATGRTYVYFDNGVMVFHSPGTIHIYYRFNTRVGFFQGQETQWIRVELSTVFHGHPVPFEEVMKVPGMNKRFNPPK